MASTTPNMGLTRWDLLSDPYDHAAFAGNWTKVDQHNHAAGNGVQIPTGGIVPGAITNALIAAGAITGGPGGSLASGTITLSNLAAGLLTAITPIGAVIPWYLPSNASDSVPVGFVVCDGSSILAANHGFATGGQAITLPDLRNKFILGADVTNTGTGPTTPPAIGAIGGTHMANLSHGHSETLHNHTVQGHGHQVNSHVHAILNHDHIVGGHGDDGAHNHKWFSQEINTRPVAFISGSVFVDNNTGFPRSNTLQAAYIAGIGSGSGNTVVPMDASNPHYHGGQTWGLLGSPTTDAQTPGTSVTPLTTDLGGSGATGGESPSLLAKDIRPQYVGLLYIMKVKYN